jgi:hypothetical protein
MLAREKPHCGVSGVPFMNRTTGAEATALSIAVRVSLDKRRAWRTEGIEEPEEGNWMAERTGRKKVGRETGRKAFICQWNILSSECVIHTEVMALKNMVITCARVERWIVAKDSGRVSII